MSEDVEIKPGQAVYWDGAGRLVRINDSENCLQFIAPVDLQENDMLLVNYFSREILSVIRNGDTIWLKEEATDEDV